MNKTLKIKVIKADKRAFKGDDENWYNLNKDRVEDMSAFAAGDEVDFVYEQKGVSRYISEIKKHTTNAAPVKEEGKFYCEVCGKELKDGKYKKCYECNMAKTEKSQESSEKEAPKKEDGKFYCKDCGKELKDNKYDKCYDCNKKNPSPKKQGFKGKGNNFYGSAEDIKGKEVGCAMGAAASVASGGNFTDPEQAKQFTLFLAEAFLEWIHNHK